MNKLLIDTNVLIYSIDQDSQFYVKARNILANPDYNHVTTSKNLVEFLTVITRSTGYDIKVNEALEILLDIIETIEVIYPNQESLAILIQLLNNYQIRGLKIHDFEIASIGLAAGIYQVATFNEKDFKEIKEISLVGF